MQKGACIIIPIFLGVILIAGCITPTPLPEPTPTPRTISAEAREWNRQGISLEAEGKYNEAVEAFSRAIALEPDYYEAWLNNVSTLEKAKRYEEALASLDHAIELRPDLLYHWVQKGKILMELQRYDEAVKAFDRVLTVNPNNEEVKQLRSLALTKMQK